MRLAPRIIIPTALFMLLIGYQNFSVPTSAEWDSQHALKVIQEMQEFQKNDPGLPQELAVPQGGSDFESVRNNWAERQSKLLLNGFDKKVENIVNDKINAFVQSFIQREPAEDTAPVEGSVDMASVSPKSTPTDLTKSIVASEEKPRHILKFPRPNMIKYEVGSDASVNVIANPGETLVNYSQAYNARTHMGIEHATSKGQTQMFFRYDW